MRARETLNATATSETPEKVDWRFRSNYNSTGNEKWSTSKKWLD